MHPHRRIRKDSLKKKKDNNGRNGSCLKRNRNEALPIQASLTRLLLSLSVPPFESKFYPKYLNVVITVFSLSSPSCISSLFLELLS